MERNAMTNDGCCRTALYCDYYYSFFFFCILFVHAPSKAGVLRAITETTDAGGKCAREFAPLLKMLNRKFLHRMKRKAQRHVTRRTDCMCAEIAIWLMTTNGGKTEKKKLSQWVQMQKRKKDWTIYLMQNYGENSENSKNSESKKNS